MSAIQKLDLRRLLSFAFVYNFLGSLMAPSDWRSQFVRSIVKAKDGDRILDVGCGPAEVLSVMPDVDYVGFDTSLDYIESARERYGARGTFIHQELTADVVDDLPPFDIVMSVGVLHHLDDDQAILLFKTAKEALKQGGRLITFDGAYTKSQSPIAKLLLDMDRGEYVRTPDAYKALASKVFSNVDVDVRTDILRVPYTHCIMSCS